MRFRTLLVMLFLAAAAGSVLAVTVRAEEPIPLGNRLEPFVDEYLIDSFSHAAELCLHPPVEREIAIVHDEPWEGNVCTYHTVFQDGDLYRMYYRGDHIPERGDRPRDKHPPYTCYAESRNGIVWTKPDLGLFEFAGSTHNNIVHTEDADNFAPFKDANPAAKPDERYKAVAGYRIGGLHAYKSPDGLRWKKMSDVLIMTDGRFDSLNVVFFDTNRYKYVAYFRDFRDGKRDMKTCTSDDFLHWTKPQWLEYPDAPVQQLYTNAIKPYARAPQILIGLPKRFISNRNPSGRQSPGVSDALLMTSRDGRNFHRWSEAIVRPGLNPERWISRNNLPAWGIVETESEIPGAPHELSMFATEDYNAGEAAKLRRYTWRLDGFVSIHAPYDGGEAVTRPITFSDGKLESDHGQLPRNDAVRITPDCKVQLVLNVSTSAAGRVRVELQDATGRPIPGYTLSNCKEILGDTIAWPVAWQGGSNLASLAGRPIRLRFALKDADVYAMQFRRKEQ